MFRANMTWPMWKHRPYEGKWQAGFSITAGAIVAVCGLITQLWHSGSFGDYLAFLVGLATILALMGSVTFALLLYYIQAIPSASEQLFHSFQGYVKELRDFLDEKFESGIIDDSYDGLLRGLENMRSKEFDVLSDLKDVIEPWALYTKQQRVQLEESGNFDEVLRGMSVPLIRIQETMQQQSMIKIRKLMFYTIRDPVRRTFATLAILILGLLASTIYFEGFLKPILYGLGIGVGFMTLFLVFEFRMIAQQESRQVDYTIHRNKN